MHGHRVVRTTLDGAVTTVVELPHDRPSGLGWLPDGRLLIAAMESQRLLRLENDGSLVEHADLSAIARGWINDMIVATDGTAYVADAGARMFDDGPVEWQRGQTIRVSPGGVPSCAADDLMAPNGHALTEDGKTLFVAESRASCLTAFDVGPGGTLTNRRVFAHIAPVDGQQAAPPDGICYDREGAVWVAEVRGRRLIRVREGGAIEQTVAFEDSAPIACVLGGDDRTTLLVCVAPSLDHHVLEAKPRAWVAAFHVAVAGSGRP
jgi:sugar lactone lactonase YvrE